MLPGLDRDLDFHAGAGPDLTVYHPFFSLRDLPPTAQIYLRIGQDSVIWPFRRSFLETVPGS
jgi:hypothetical protein